jgi:hypothetical protein
MVKLEGVEKVQRNLNREINKIRGRTRKGLLKAAIYLRRRMDEVSPMIPVDTNHMRGSWFIEPFGSEVNPALRLGFTAEYAWFVHENVGARFKRPGAGAKFLQARLQQDGKQILNIIASEAKV